MNDDEILARFGISSKLRYGLIIQSLLVLVAAIISLWGVFKLYNPHYFSLRFITNIFSLLVCISMLVYSFYGFNSKTHQEAFFKSTIVLYIILTLLGLFSSSIDFKNPFSLVTAITLISAIFFLQEYNKNYVSANFAILLIIISATVVVFFNVLAGMPWFTAIKYIILPFTIGLTYFERVQRGKYPLL